jgi:putative flippase GtrA
VQFARYIFVGLANTFAHWLVFLLLYAYVIPSQAISNAIAFACAVTLGFFLNSRWTFKKTATSRRFVLYSGFMGMIALAFGLVSDIAHLNPFITLILFSATSLGIGFIYSKYFVFRT